MSKWGADGVLAAHAKHRSVIVDASTIRCVDCCHTLLLDSGRTVATSAADQAASALQVEGMTEGKARVLTMRQQREAELAAAASPDAVAQYAQQARADLAARRDRRRGA